MASTWIWEREGGLRKIDPTAEGLPLPAAGDGTTEAAPRRPRRLEATAPQRQSAGLTGGDALWLPGGAPAGRGFMSEGVWLVNEGAEAASAMSDETRQSRWRRAGLATGDGRPGERRLVRIVTANLEPCEMRRLDGDDGGEARGPLASAALLFAAPQERAAGWPISPPLRKAARLAARALHALGLDIGEAVMSLGDDGRIAVVDARPLRPDTLRAAAALRRFAASHAAAAIGDRSRILLGADPEFALLTPEGKLAPASRYLGVGGPTGADALLVGRRVLHPVAELRPAPEATPAALAAGVRRLLAQAAAAVRDPGLRWVAGAMPLPGLALGGHIHLSGAALTSRLLRLLDRCVAYPLAMVEDPAGRGRRPRYGALGDFRLQPHGGFEYRTPPSWLVSPAAAKAAFALALLCARESPRLSALPAGGERFEAAYYAGDRIELSGCLDDIAAALAATESYDRLSRYIEPLFEAARRGDTWNESSDIRRKWRIPLSPADRSTAPFV